MKKAVYFILISLLAFTSCKKDGSNPVNTDTVPAPPTLASPTDTSSNIAVPVVLTWKESSGAKSYTLQVSASSSFSSFVFNKSDITTTTQQVPDLNYLAVYYWRVNATNSVGTSDWSKVWSFTTTGEAAFIPQLSLPANGAVDQKLSPVLTWDKVNNASKYTLQISTNSSFTSFVFDSDTLTATSKQITDLSGSTKYYWRVSATNNFGTKGWSETWSFTTGIAPVPPILLSPTDGATDVTLSPTLTWNASIGATSYTLQVSTSSSFTSFVFNQNVTTTNKQITGLANTTKYYWRVSTTNNFGTSNFAAVWSFTTGTPPAPPTLLEPTNGAIDISRTPMLTWSAINDAISYSLKVSTDSSFTNFVFNESVATSNHLLTGLTNSTKYYWRVKVTNNFGTSAESSTWSFTTQGVICEAKLTYAGRTYNIVKIGNQCWLKENLDVGTMVSGSIDQNNNNTIEKYCYNNNSANCTTYGGLYQWWEAMQYISNEKAKGICPVGWHIPSKKDFETLATAVNNDGNALKEVGQGNQSGAGTNTSGFSVLLSGYRGSDGKFYNQLNNTSFWISERPLSTIAYKIYLTSTGSNIAFSDGNMVEGYSIRCLMD